jgi:uncharacterized protein YbjT (DUF2867 family)
MKSIKTILVTGSTGYIGGRIVPHLLDAGYQTRCLVRDPARLQGRAWYNRVDIITGDVLQPETLPEAMQNIDVAYYLIHSLAGGTGFHKIDIMAAQNFSKAAKKAGIKRIIYLGGLGNPDTDLSQHLRSRQLTGDALRESGIPVTEFRAGVIVGSGSLSFELIRYLTERIPVMICPRWVYTKIQPIAIGDVIEYLVAAINVPESSDQIIEIGGADVITYGEMMSGYAKARGLKRWLIPVPLLTPRLSSYWVHLMTPVPANIAKPLIEGLRNEVIVRDDKARSLFPNNHPVSYQKAVELALQKLEAGSVETAWSDALVSSQGEKEPVFLKTHEGMIIEHRQKIVDVLPENVYRVFTSLGGKQGWLYMNWAWKFRGIMDRLIGGVGMRRGRRDPVDIRIGDVLDFWRVEEVIPNRMIRLRAEMKVPGRAWLQFQVLSKKDGRSVLSQTAFFAPKGLAGLSYWYILYPIHRIIFSGMIREIKKIAERDYQQV